VRLEEIETGERLFDRHMSGMYPGATDSLILWWLTYGPALLAAAKTAASERSRADKAEAELAGLREAAGPFLEEWLRRDHLKPGPDIDDWLIGGSALTYGDLRRLARAVKGEG
jgi:hypothetical protein